MSLGKRVAMLCTGLVIAAVMPLPAVAADGARISVPFSQPITNVPGKSLIAVEVDYPPGDSTPPHHHAKSAFIMGYVISGAIRSQVKGQPAHVFHTGQTFYERPGADHLVSANASKTKPAKLLAIFVVDTKHGPLTTLDKPPARKP